MIAEETRNLIDAIIVAVIVFCAMTAMVCCSVDKLNPPVPDEEVRL